MSRATKRKATRSHEQAQFERRLQVERAQAHNLRIERDAAQAEAGRLRAVVRELERKLNIPESESRATIKPYRRDDE